MIKSIISYFLVFLFCLFFVVGIVGYYFESNLFNTDKYMEAIYSGEYDEIVLETVNKRLDDLGDEITLDANDIFPLLNKDSLKEHSYQYTKNFFSAFEKGEKFNNSLHPKYDISYIKDELKQLVINFYQKNNSENNFSEEEYESIYNLIELEINNALKFLPSSFINRLSSATKYVETAKFAFKVMKMFLIPSVLLLAGIILLTFKNGITALILRVGSAFFFPSALLFIPTILFDNYNLGSKVAIMRSPLSVVFSTVLNCNVKGFETLTGIFFFISILLLIAGAVLTVLNVGKTRGDN